MTLLNDYLPLASGILVPFLGWLWARIKGLEKEAIKVALDSKRLEDLEKRLTVHEFTQSTTSERVHNLEIAVARIDSKLDMILSHVSTLTGR